MQFNMPDVAPIFDVLQYGYSDGKNIQKFKAAWEYARDQYAKDFSHYLNLIERIGFVKGENAIDVGSGAGHWCMALAQFNKHVVGIDLNVEYIQISEIMACNFPNGARIRFIQGTAEKINYPDLFFDYLICHGVLMFTNHEIAIKEFSRIMRANGKIYIGYSGYGWYLHYIIKLGLIDNNMNRIKTGIKVLLNSFKYKYGLYDFRKPWLSMPLEDLEKLLNRFNFKIIDTPLLQDGFHDFISYQATYDLVAVKTEDQETDWMTAPDISDENLDEKLKNLIKIGLPNRVSAFIESNKLDHSNERKWKFILAEAYIKEGKQEYSNAILSTLKPESPYEFLIFGLNDQLNKNYSNAISYYSRVWEVDIPSVKFLRAECLRNMNQIEDARDSYADIIQEEKLALPAWIGLMACSFDFAGIQDLKRVVKSFLTTLINSGKNADEISELINML